MTISLHFLSVSCRPINIAKFTNQLFFNTFIGFIVALNSHLMATLVCKIPQAINVKRIFRTTVCCYFLIVEETPNSEDDDAITDTLDINLVFFKLSL